MGKKTYIICVILYIYKPEVYRSVDGKVIVKDELLNFLAVKSRTLSQDEIVLLAVNTFDSERIEASKKVLFELCPSSQLNISHKGAQKDTNNIKSCLKVLSECGENVPRFVSYYLEDLPQWLSQIWMCADCLRKWCRCMPTSVL